MMELTESLNVSVAAACILQRVTTSDDSIGRMGDLGEERKAAFDRMWQEREDAVGWPKAATA